MKTSPFQKLRYLRAKNKGLNVKLARELRKAADMLDKKRSGEFSELEFARLLSVEEFISNRLKGDVLAQKTDAILAELHKRGQGEVLKVRRVVGKPSTMEE